MYNKQHMGLIQQLGSEAWLVSVNLWFVVSLGVQVDSLFCLFNIIMDIFLLDLLFATFFLVIWVIVRDRHSKPSI